MSVIAWDGKTLAADKRAWTGLLIIGFQKNSPPQQFAIGSGRDFALAAMHLGKTAAEAVEIACLFDNACGNGVDVLMHQNEQARNGLSKPISKAEFDASAKGYFDSSPKPSGVTEAEFDALGRSGLSEPMSKYEFDALEKGLNAFREGRTTEEQKKILDERIEFLALEKKAENILIKYAENLKNNPPRISWTAPWWPF